MVWLLPISLALFPSIHSLSQDFQSYCICCSLNTPSLFLLQIRHTYWPSNWKDLLGWLPLSCISVHTSPVCHWGLPWHQMETVPSSVPTTYSNTIPCFLKNNIYHHLNSSCTLLSLCPLVSIRREPRIRAGTLSFLFTLPWATKTHRRSIRNTNECLNQVTEVFLITRSAPLFIEKEASNVASGGHKFAWAEGTPHTLKRTAILENVPNALEVWELESWAGWPLKASVYWVGHCFGSRNYFQKSYMGSRFRIFTSEP